MPGFSTALAKKKGKFFLADLGHLAKPRRLDPINARITAINASAHKLHLTGVTHFLLSQKGFDVVKHASPRSWTIVALVVASSLSGCGTAKAPEEKLVSASGTIKLDGQPAEGVRIRLTPINDTKTVGGAWAVTKADGTFNVIHWSNKEGVTPGSYLITFSKLVKPDGTPLGENDSPSLVQAKDIVAPQWSNPEPDQRVAVTRRVDVPESGKTDINFSITSSKK